MGFKKGESGNPSGRPPGTENKATKEIKAVIHEVFENLGGVEAMLSWARANPTIFYSKLLAKLIPLDVSGTLDVRHLDLRENSLRIARALQGEPVALPAPDDKPERPN